MHIQRVESQSGMQSSGAVVSCIAFSFAVRRSATDARQSSIALTNPCVKHCLRFFYPVRPICLSQNSLHFARCRPLFFLALPHGKSKPALWRANPLQCLIRLVCLLAHRAFFGFYVVHYSRIPLSVMRRPAGSAYRFSPASVSCFTISSFFPFAKVSAAGAVIVMPLIKISFAFLISLLQS